VRHDAPRAAPGRVRTPSTRPRPRAGHVGRRDAPVPRPTPLRIRVST
jgi:hypothetical protein